jgi:hypothetical protein
VTGLEFQSSKGTAFWPEEELEGLEYGLSAAGRGALGGAGRAGCITNPFEYIGVS